MEIAQTETTQVIDTLPAGTKVTLNYESFTGAVIDWVKKNWKWALPTVTVITLVGVAFRK
jgi:hypothetical protein